MAQAASLPAESSPELGWLPWMWLSRISWLYCLTMDMLGLVLFHRVKSSWWSRVKPFSLLF